MRKFDPKQAHYLTCDLVYQEFRAHPVTMLSDASVAPVYVLKQFVLPSSEQRYLIIWLRIDAQLSGATSKRTAMATHIFRNVFELENFSDLVQNPQSGRAGHIDSDLMAAVLSMSVSTARGQLQVLMAGTPFHGFHLPLQSIEDVMQLPVFDMKALIEDWETG